MLEKSRLATFVFWLLVLSAGLSSFWALRPAIVIPQSQAITQRKFECEFVSFHRDELGKQDFHCLDEDSLRKALVLSAGFGVATLSALAYIIVIRRKTKTRSEWRDNLSGYLAIVGVWIWLTALYIASIRLTHFAYGRVNMDYFFVTLIWITIVIALPLMTWLESRSNKK